MTNNAKQHHRRPESGIRNIRRERGDAKKQYLRFHLRYIEIKDTVESDYCSGLEANNFARRKLGTN